MEGLTRCALRTAPARSVCGGYQIFAVRCGHFNNSEIQAHSLHSLYKPFLRTLRGKLYVRCSLGRLRMADMTNAFSGKPTPQNLITCIRDFESPVHIPFLEMCMDIRSHFALVTNCCGEGLGYESITCIRDFESLCTFHFSKCAWIYAAILLS
jgi:hypothetical protein